LAKTISVHRHIDICFPCTLPIASLHRLGVGAKYQRLRTFLAFVGQSSVAYDSILAAKPIILMFGGVFLLYLYFHWLFLEEKEPLFIERYLRKKHGVWFFAFASIFLVLIMYLARASPLMMLAAAIGSATFFILYGLKQTAEESERNLVEVQAA
jgi:hypothetical protein